MCCPNESPRAARHPRGGSMFAKATEVFARPFAVGVLATAVLLAWAPPGDARVTRIIVDTRTTPAFAGATYGSAGQYETLLGRVYGELDPNDPHNVIINDIDLAPKNERGMV